MGMSASQARLLSLTARLSDLEYQAQSISNSKIRLADESAAASKDYSDALDKEKLTVYAGVDNQSNSTYVDATAYNLTTYNAIPGQTKQRFIKDASGKVVVTTKVGQAYDNAGDAAVDFVGNDGNTYNGSSNDLKKMFATVDLFLKNTTYGLGYATVDEYCTQNPGANAADKANAQKQITYYTNLYSGQEEFMQQLGYTSNPNNTDPALAYDNGAASYYANVFNEIQESGGYSAPGDDNLKNSEWLQAQITAGDLFLYVPEQENGATKDFVNVSWDSGDASLQEQDDKSDLARAEAKYDATMADIQSKDKRFDLDLKAIDTEHEAISTEIDSVKKIIDKNIEKSFKIFDA